MNKTTIQLEYPYSKKWRKGYLNINKDNRRTLTLFNSGKDRSSVQYARYLLAIKLGRFLSDNEEADHIDGDKTNDCVTNLQVLTKKDHRAKGVVHLKGNCYVCGVEFTRTKTQLRPKIKQTLIVEGKLTCSRKCGYKKAAETLKNKT